MKENAITVPMRDINTIASEIRYIKEDVQQYAAAGALKIGERLCEAKELLGHGEFLPWLKDEFGWTDRTAQKLMAVYREFGESQKSLFGPGINTNTCSDLPVSKLYLLISVPESEREEFVKENRIEEISVREMEKLLKEKKEAEENARESADALEELERKAAAAREEGRAAAAKQLAEEVNTAKLNVREAAAAQKKAEEELQAALAEAERYKAETEKLRENPEVPEEKLRELEEKYAEKLKAAEAQARLNDPIVAVFRVHFNAVQKEFREMLELINAMDDECAGKLKAAVSAVLDGFRRELDG